MFLPNNFPSTYEREKQLPKLYKLLTRKHDNWSLILNLCMIPFKKHDFALVNILSGCLDPENVGFATNILSLR
jgi:hypothetical protein